MALEDFFTLSEMKDGLFANNRVEELVAAMQKEKDSDVKNVSETARAGQWSTVAKTLAATKNMEVLKQFIHLGGLYFFDKWLQEAQQYNNNTSESPLEESICELLTSLEKLPIDNETPFFSGFMVSVENLIEHKSLRVQQRAKALFDIFIPGKEKECHHLVAEKDGRCDGEVKSLNATATVVTTSVESSAVNNEAGDNEDKAIMGLSGNELQHPGTDCSQKESVAVVEESPSKKQNISHTTFSQVDESDVVEGDAQDSSIMSNPTVKESPVHPAGGTTSFGTCSFPVTEGSSGKTNTANVLALNFLSNECTETQSAEQNPDKFVEKEDSDVSSSFGAVHVSSADTHAHQSGTEPAVLNDADDKESEFCAVRSLPTGVDSNASTVVSNPSDGGVGFGLLNQSTEVNLKTTGQNDGTTTDHNDGICSNVSQDLSVTDCILGKTGNVKTSFPQEAIDVKESVCESVIKVGGSENSATTGDTSDMNTDMKASNEPVKSKLDMEIDYIEDDNLEVARQVAKEVEREVVDSREPSCSSSSKQNLELRVLQPGSPDSVNGEHNQPMEEPQNKMLVEQNCAGGVISPIGKEHVLIAKSMDNNHDLSQVTEAVQEPVYEKSTHGFDLNEESYSQDMDQPKVIVSSSITAASTPKALDLKLHSAPPCYVEEKSECSGSAATSAVCPAFLRIQEAEKAFSVEGSSSSKQRQDFLNIDLNVTEQNNDGTTDVIQAKMPLSSGLPSGESSVEVNSKRAKRLKWDLNNTVENGERSPSPISSFLSKPPAVNILDLNDNPSLDESHDYPSDHGASSSNGRNSYRGHQLDGPCISIMGVKVPIPREEVTPQTRFFLPNGPVPVSSVCANSSQSDGEVLPEYAMAYMPPSSAFGYNGLRLEPFTNFPTVMYGSPPVPYTVDPREVPMGQKIMGSSMAVPPSYSKPPFPMNMITAPSGFNWIASPQPNLNLGSGLFMADPGSREQGTSRQGLIPGQANMMEEQMGSTSSGMRLKRREPESECDPYLGAYRREPPWC